MKPSGARTSRPAAAARSFAASGLYDLPGGVITLAIVESDHAIRRSLEELFGQSPGLRCIGSYACVSEALSGLPELRPDVMLFDARLLSPNGSGLVARLKASSPSTQILILTTFDLGGLTFESVCEGASGDLPKTTPATELFQAVQWVHAGGSLMSMPLARRVTAHFQSQQGGMAPARSLTPMEQEVVSALARGNAYPVIAGEFGMEVPAVFSLLRGVCEKLGDRPRVT